MRAFTALFTRIDETNRTNEKVVALVEYFSSAPAEQAAWALFFLSGKRLPALVKTKTLRNWAAQLSGYPEWLVDESYRHVGDLAETLALILPEAAEEPEEALPLDQLVEEKILPLRDWDEPIQFQLVREAWAGLGPRGRFLYNKLITGSFRIGVSRTLVVRALAQVAAVDQAMMEHRLMGDWQPSAEAYRRLLSPDDGSVVNPAQPYPFYLAYPLEEDPRRLGDLRDWQVEWKWDGIRAQLIKRQGGVYLWSRGEEMLTERFPEIAQAAATLPDGCVLDGEVICWEDGKPLPFNQLQRRIGRRDVNAKVLAEAPAAFIAYDLLEKNGADIREQPMERRQHGLSELLEELPEGSAIRRSELVRAETWDDLEMLREESRERGVEGLMLKMRAGVYRAGRVKGEWWKWKVAPHSIDAVMVYAEMGHGRRAGLFTDYTFAVWDGDQLVPFAKAYSGLTDKEIRQLDHWIKRHSKDRHGPVRVVEPVQVFELHFEGIAESTRHKSGVAVRFPRMHRWRSDKKPEEADTLQTVRALLPEIHVGAS